ncbi:hypothetical protein HZF02_10090 [Pseudomonas yamanorum]|nr:hypothetical protein HZF02_10090 [Pseudomonas yamanorum]
MIDSKEDSTLQSPITDLARNALDAIKASRERIDLEIENLSFKIGELTKQESQARNGSLSLDDYSGFLLDEIKKRSDNYASLWLGSRHSSQPGRGQHSAMRWPDFEESEAGQLLSKVLQPEVTSDALCFLFPEVMHERLMTCLREGSVSRWGGTEGGGIAKHREVLQTIKEEIAALKGQRDSLFRQLNDINNAIQIR